MKRILLSAAISGVVISCGDSKTNNEEPKESILQQKNVTTDTIAIVQSSQLRFDDALSALKDKRKKEAAMILQAAVKLLKGEKEDIKINDVKDKMQLAVSNIEAAEDSLEDKKDINFRFLKKNISRTELLLAKHYFTSLEIPESVDKTYVAMNKTVELMEAGLLHSDDNMKMDDVKIVADTKLFLKKPSTDKTKYAKEMKEHVQKIKQLLEEHTK
ncbi:MAG: hypothetical protein ACOYVG_05180 [Bacteroidota bacterium]